MIKGDSQNILSNLITFNIFRVLKYKKEYNFEFFQDLLVYGVPYKEIHSLLYELPRKLSEKEVSFMDLYENGPKTTSTYKI